MTQVSPEISSPALASFRKRMNAQSDLIDKGFDLLEQEVYEKSSEEGVDPMMNERNDKLNQFMGSEPLGRQ